MDKYIVLRACGTAVRQVKAVPPTVIAKYETDRYGELQEFTVCDTSVGDAVFHTDVQGRRKEYTVVINDVTYGDAWYPDEYLFVAQFKGYV